jgi:hypothetical protein
LEGKLPKEKAVRKVLLLAALSMAATLVFAAMASAQADLDCPQLSEEEEQAVFAMDPSDPHGLDADDDGVPCEDDTTDDGSFALPEETTMMDELTGGIVFSGGGGGGLEQTTVSPATDQYTTASAAPLPDTGGNSPELALFAVALLVGGGLLTSMILRRS